MSGNVYDEKVQLDEAKMATELNSSRHKWSDRLDDIINRLFATNVC
jgi:hypothetical protein